MRAEDRIRLMHMVEASQTAMQFVAGRQSMDLQTDRMLLFAVVRAIDMVWKTVQVEIPAVLPHLQALTEK